MSRSNFVFLRLVLALRHRAIAQAIVEKFILVMTHISFLTVFLSGPSYLRHKGSVSLHCEEGICDELLVL
jgi:D-alanyl-lipoteichoic acid acyltransferase DltB (MBOAT superfamily)